MGQGEIGLSKKQQLTELLCKADARGGCGDPCGGWRLPSNFDYEYTPLNEQRIVGAVERLDDVVRLRCLRSAQD